MCLHVYVRVSYHLCTYVCMYAGMYVWMYKYECIENEYNVSLTHVPSEDLPQDVLLELCVASSVENGLLEGRRWFLITSGLQWGREV